MNGPSASLSFRYFENPIVLHAMPSSHDVVIRMFHCHFISLKTPLLSIPSNHDPVIRMILCHFISMNIPLLSIPSSDQNALLSFH